MRVDHRGVSRAALAVIFFAGNVAVLAQPLAYPVKPVRLVVAYPSPSTPDSVARVVGQRMSEALGQSFIVENRPGAGGIVAAEAVARSAADGYTLMVGDVGPFALVSIMTPGVKYDIERDFSPVAMLGSVPFFLAVSGSLGVTNLRELSDLVRSRPAQLNYGSSGTGSIHHFITEYFLNQAGLRMVHVPYKGTVQTVPALLAGDISALFVTVGGAGVVSNARSGALRIIAAATASRSKDLPDIPTFAEQGMPGIEFAGEFGMMSPVGTPAPIIARLGGEAIRAVQHAETVKRLAGAGVEPFPLSPEEYGRRIRGEVTRYHKIAKTVNLKTR